MYRILGDVHTHTLFSRHAFSTIAENVAAARAAGLEVLGSADHFSEMIYPGTDLRNFQHFTNMTIWPRIWDGVLVLRGAEVDIVSIDGELFGQKALADTNLAGQPFKEPKVVFERVTRHLDYLVASVHNPSFADGATIAQTTEMYVRALENPKVLILGHTGRAGVPFDIDEVLTCAKERHKLIEINEHSLEGEHHHATCRKIAERCAELGVGIAVSTDAHLACYIGQFKHATDVLDEVHFPEELIANRGRAPFVAQMAAAGVCDLTAELAEE